MHGASQMSRAAAICVVLCTLCLVWICKSADIPSEGAGSGMAEQEQMAWLANAVYKFRTPIAGWELAQKLQLESGCAGEKDNFALYRYPAGRQCVIAVAGTDSAFDMFDNFDGRLASDCGFEGIHSGYMKEVNDLLHSCGFQDRFLPELTSNNCSGGISAVGHSLGGGVATVFAACANNPLRPYGFNISKLWTFGAPAVSRPNALHNAQASDHCFSGARIWNQDGVQMDPIPGLSRGLNFIHPRIKAVRLKDVFVFGIDKDEYKCGSWQSYELPNPVDATPNPLLHLMSEYCKRTRQEYTGSSFNSPTYSSSDTPPPADPLLHCKREVNYTYAKIEVLHEPVKSDFAGWGHTRAGIATGYFVSFLCIIALVWGGCRLQLLTEIKKSITDYHDKHYLEEFFYQCMEGLDQEKPKDPLDWIAKYAQECRDNKAHKLNKDSRQNLTAMQSLMAPLLWLADRFGCAKCFGRRAKSTRRHRSHFVQYAFFIFLQGWAMFFCAIARTVLNSYDEDGQGMGRKWGDTNAGWMFPWTAGIVVVPIASATAYGVVLTFLEHSDWTVHDVEIIGFIGTAAELQLMWTENLTNSGKVASLLSIAAGGFAALELFIYGGRQVHSQFLVSGSFKTAFGVAAKDNLAAILLLFGMMFICVGHCIHFGAPCEFPHNSGCPFPESFSVNAIYHVFLIGAVVCISFAVLAEVREAAALRRRTAPEKEETPSPETPSAQPYKLPADATDS